MLFVIRHSSFVIHTMYLVLDFGNTNKKIALFNKGRLIHLEQYRKIGLRMLQNFIRAYPGITHVILSSVVDYPSSIQAFLEKKFIFLELTHLTPLPVKNKYRKPETLGKDRLAAAVAGASFAAGSPVLVINCGTCITYDFVNEKREYLGGGISPGLRMRFSALHTFTGKLPFISSPTTGKLIGDDTRGSLLSGVFNGMIAEMDGIIAEYRNRYPGIKVILSGGDARYFVKRLKSDIFARSNIVLHGLYQILCFHVDR